jgi:pimeloyl-ACP methyl ester carboxylesterase
MSSETVQASQTVRRIFASVRDHGVIDVFSKYPTQELLASVYALSRLQAASQAYERRKYYLDQVEEEEDDDDDDVRYDEEEDHTLNSTTTTTTPYCKDTALLEELAYFLPFASAAYGWTMDLATAGRLHFGDLEALLKKTSIRSEDVVTVNMESQANRPAFFIVRDPRRKKLVVGIRGTWSAKDLLTDLCCTPEEYQVSSSSSSSRNGGATLRTHKAHRGMLEAARGVDALARDVIAKELEADPSLSLVIVGHSLGGSVAAVLGTLWEDSFPHIYVYAYGPACVTPSMEYNHISNGGKTTVTIVSAINEADPFPVLSLGHVADVSHALARLCDNAELRCTILIRTDGRIKDMDERDLEWCSETMQGLRESMVGEKLYPPGRLLFLTRRHTRNNYTNNKGFGIRNPPRPTTNKNEPQCRAIEVPSTFFHDLVIGHRMFDLTRHVPRLYEKQLQDCLPTTADNT